MNGFALLILAVQAPVLQQDGLQFKDLNRNGVLDPYEDRRLSPEQRARDLVRRMTLEEKAAAMMHGTARSTGPMPTIGMGAQYDTAAIRALIDADPRRGPRVDRELRRERCSVARRAHRPGGGAAGGEIAVRATVVDGRSRGAALGRAA